MEAHEKAKEAEVEREKPKPKPTGSVKDRMAALRARVSSDDSCHSLTSTDLSSIARKEVCLMHEC